MHSRLIGAISISKARRIATSTGLGSRGSRRAAAPYAAVLMRRFFPTRALDAVVAGN
jgi:hypothetical protein